MRLLGWKCRPPPWRPCSRRPRRPPMAPRRPQPQEAKMARKKKTVTIAGSTTQAPVTFKHGALHRQLGVPQDEKIPASKMAAAKRGDYGPLAAKRAHFADNMLKAGRKTAAKRR